MLDQSLSEARWQRFFEDNIFILTMVFTRPVRLLHTQFHAEGSGLDGSGAQVGDFLFAEHGPALAIVEIKKPDTDLLLNTPYRNKQVFGAAAELSGAVTQVLYQQSSLRSKWLLHATRPELQHARPDNIRCVVIAGRLPTEDMKRRSFDIFRNACKDVDVVTFDELLEKLRLMLRHLNDEQATAQVVPF
ncbi:Shedu immune nuclease family protein [Burkholderia gladioli]|nr:Shedu immune nuclease family protein [Burkholderia gladioli]